MSQKRLNKSERKQEKQRRQNRRGNVAWNAQYEEKRDPYAWV